MAIAGDRYGTIAGIVAKLEPTWGQHVGWEAEFTAALNGASDAQLLNIQNATSYDEVRAILQGWSSFTDARFDLTEDLTYTPVVPCRFFDTQFDSTPGTANPPGTKMDYYVHGSAGLLAPQGHTAGTGCSSPKGEPSAIAANFTVEPFAKGNIRVWPFTFPEPGASFLNYHSTTGTNLANAGIVQTCYLCGKEISVRTQFGAARSLGDVMGYFYPAQSNPAALDCTTVKSSIVAVPFNAWTNVDAFCPGGYRATGGGYRVLEGTLGRPGVWVDPIPIVSGGQSVGWRSWVDNQASGPSRNVETWAACCRTPGI
jgi:hypothetical protein